MFSRTFILTSLCALSFFPNFCFGKAPLHSFESIVQFVEENPNSTIDDVLANLDPELRKNYSLVYSSRSPIGASLDSPRILLFNQEGTMALSVAGSSFQKGGQLLEVLTQNPRTLQLEPKQIDFSSPGRPVIEQSPTSCLKCHSTSESRLGARFIWDTYPDWPGVYGSSHYGEIQGTGLLDIPSRRGTSGIPIPEFERRSFTEFLRKGAGGRYQHLIGLKEMTLEKLAQQNTEFTVKIGRTNWNRIIPAISDRDVSLKSYLQLHHALQGRPSLDPSGADSVLSAEREYVENKKTRLLSTIKQFGTPEDRKKFEGEIPYLSSSMEGPARQMVLEKRPFMAKMGTGFSDIYSSIASVLRERFGISPDDLAFTGELKSYAFETGRIRQSFSTSPFLKAHLPALYEERYQASLSKALNPEEFAETIRTAVQLPIRKSRLSKIARNSIPRLLTLPGDVFPTMNSLIADEAIPQTLQAALVDASLRHTGFSADQANFLINHPSIDWETRKKVWNAVLARGDAQVNRSLKVPLSMSNPLFSKCAGFYLKISK